MALTPFIKAWSAGSDLILFPQGWPISDVDKLPIEQICDRNIGIGGEGIVLLEMNDECPHAAAYTPEGDFFWNGIFAAAKYSFESGLYSPSHFEIATPKGRLRFNPLDRYFYQYFPHISQSGNLDRMTLKDIKGKKIAGFLSEKKDFFFILGEEGLLQVKKSLKGMKRTNSDLIRRAFALSPHSPEEVLLLGDSSNKDLTALAQTLAPTLLSENWLNHQFTLKTSKAEIIISKFGDSLSLAAPTRFIFEGEIEL